MVYLLGVISAVYLSIMLLMYFFQDHLIFHPTKNIHSTPADLGVTYEEVELETADGVQLHGWFIPAEGDDRTIILFHGNAGNIANRIYLINSLRELGINIFIFDYRGYGKSEGSPDEDGLYSDGRAAWQYITEVRSIDPQKVILFGRSLGSAVATRLAEEYEAGALILDAPFTSGKNLGADLYPWLPVRMLMKYDFDNTQRIKELSIPLLIAHSRTDRVVPYHHGEELFEAAGEPKEFVELEGHHGSGFEGSGHYLESLQNFIDQYVPSNGE